MKLLSLALLVACDPMLQPATGSDDTGGDNNGTAAQADSGSDGSDGGSTDGSDGSDGGSTDGSDGSDGGSTDGSDGSDGSDGGDDAFPVDDVGNLGPHSVQQQNRTVDVGGGCSLTIVEAAPVGVSTDVVVMIGHGFARSGTHVQGWGDHLASWGMRTLTVTFCHSTLLDVDHHQNGVDLAALGALQAEPGRIYVGHSAGGLAAMVAGASDPDALAVITLDGVEDSTVGQSAAGSLAMPLFGLVGESSTCNSSNNATGWFSAAADSRALRVTEADHCDFESNTDELCTWFCTGSGSSFSDEQIRSTITSLLTAAVVDAAQLGEAAASWWEPGGDNHDQLVASGEISTL